MIRFTKRLLFSLLFSVWFLAGHLAAQQIDTTFTYHRVKKGETLNFLAIQYKIEAEDILRYNPLAAKSLKKGDILKMPILTLTHNPTQNPEPSDPENAPDVPGDLVTVVDYTNNPCGDYIYEGQTFRIALLLPLFVEGNQYMKISGKEKPAINYYKNSKKFIEFYQGLIMALDPLAQAGMNISLHVYDTKQDPIQVAEILKDTVFNNIDLIIGPAYEEDLQVATTFAKEKEILLLSPFSPSDSLIADNPFYVQLNTSGNTRLIETCRFISKVPSPNIIILHAGTAAEQEDIKLIGNKLKEFMHTDTVPLKTYRASKGTYDGHIRLLMSESHMNVVLIPSGDKIYVGDMVNKLIPVSERYDMAVVGSAVWENYGNIDMEYLRTLNMHLHSNIFFNYTDPAVGDFICRYHDIFKTEPGHYALYGYDVMLLAGKLLKKYGPSLNHCLTNEKEITGLISKFRFRKEPDGGYENEAIYILRYTEDFLPEEVDATQKEIFLYQTH